LSVQRNRIAGALQLIGVSLVVSDGVAGLGNLRDDAVLRLHDVGRNAVDRNCVEFADKVIAKLNECVDVVLVRIDRSQSVIGATVENLERSETGQP